MTSPSWAAAKTRRACGLGLRPSDAARIKGGYLRSGAGFESVAEGPGVAGEEWCVWDRCVPVSAACRGRCCNAGVCDRAVLGHGWGSQVGVVAMQGSWSRHGLPGTAQLWVLSWTCERCCRLGPLPDTPVPLNLTQSISHTQQQGSSTQDWMHHQATHGVDGSPPTCTGTLW